MIDKVYGTDLITQSIYYVVASHCGFEIVEDDKDFNVITAINKEDVMLQMRIK